MSEWMPRQCDRPKSLGRDTLPEDALGRVRRITSFHILLSSFTSFSSFSSLSLGELFRAQGALSHISSVSSTSPQERTYESPIRGHT